LRVTVAPAGGRLVGDLVALDATRITLRVKERGEPWIVRREDVLKLEASQGRRSRIRGALIGTAIGAGGGALIGSADKGYGAAGALGGALVLGLAGGVIGALVPAAERWRELPGNRLRFSVGPVRGRGAAVAVSVAF
jgi:hypothetical protein